MANEIEASKIKIRRDTTENWESFNPVLDEGEIGIEWFDLNQGLCNIKIGNGRTSWLELPYFSGDDIPYSNINEETLPTINNKKILGNLSLQDLGIQPAGNYAYTDYVNNQLSYKADISEVYSKSYIDTKFNEYSKNLVPSLENNEGKYLKVIRSNNEPTMIWSNITEDIVTTQSLEETLENYVEKEEGYSLVNEEDYNTLTQTVNTINEYDVPGISETVSNLNTEITEKVDYSELRKILTGDVSGETPISDSGYASIEELNTKASIEELNTKADKDALQAHISNAVNPHNVTKAQIGLGNVENYSAADMPISNLTQIALSGKMPNYIIDSEGLGLKETPDHKLSLYNKLKQPNWGISDPEDTACILNKPSNEDFQADWSEEDSTSLSYIKNKPEINEYILPIASSETLGGIKLGEDFTVDEEGHIVYNSSGNYEDLTHKPSFRVVQRDDNGNIITDNNGEPVYEDEELTAGMIPSDYNLASLTVAKSIDDRLERNKLDKTSESNKIYGTDENGEQCLYPFQSIESITQALEQIGDTELIAKFSNINNKKDVEVYVTDRLVGYGKVYNYSNNDYVYSIDDTHSKSYLDNKFSDIDGSLTQIEDKEDIINKTQTIHGLDIYELESKYTSAGAVKEITDELREDYNDKIDAEEDRAIARENAIENDLHTNYYTKPEVDTKVSSVYKYKGSVQSYSQLPLNNNVEGDVWNVAQADVQHGIKAGDNVAWVDTHSGVEAHWDVLAGVTDLSNYYTKQETNSTFATKGEYGTEIDELETSIEELETYVNQELSTKADNANSLAGYGITDAYTKVDTMVKINDAVRDKAEQVEVDAITAPGIYRGTVQYYDNLPDTGLNINDLYVVSSTRYYYVWDGTQWVQQVPLGNKADKATTYTKTEVDTNFATKVEVNARATTIALNNHTGNTNNPHSVTKSQVGLGNVDNTSDADKPVSTATQVALNLKQDSLSATQLNAVNSGITSAKVSSYDTAVNTIGTLATKAELGQLEQIVNTKANANNVYTKSEVYTKAEVDALIGNLQAMIQQLSNS